MTRFHKHVAWLPLMVLAIGGLSCTELAPPQAQTQAFAGAEVDSPLDVAYLDVIDALLPGMGAKEIVDRKESQLAFETVCFRASGPGHEAQRAALGRAIMMRVGPEVAKPARVWLLRKIEPIGRDEVVPGLTVLLRDEDPQIRELARRALQNNPSPMAASVLRDELLATNDDGWRIAMINALGFRRDAGSVDLLAQYAREGSDAVAQAAVAALGRVGIEEAANIVAALRRAGRSTLRDDLTAAWLISAELLAEQGMTQQAAEIYQQLDVPAESENTRLAALSGLAAVRGAAAMPRLIEHIKGVDGRLRLAAARFAQHIPDPAVTPTLIAAMEGTSPEVQTVILDVLGQRGDGAALSTVRAKASDDDATVRIAAIEALRYLGDASVVDLLAERAGRSNDEEANAARVTLNKISGRAIDEVILQNLSSAQGVSRAPLIKAAAARRIKAALPKLYEAANDTDETVRVAVFNALGSLSPTEDLSKVVGLLVKAEGEATVNAAVVAAMALCSRIGDPEQSAPPIVAGLPQAEPATRAVMLRMLGRLEGDAALAAVRECARSEDSTVRDAATEVLSKWSPQHCTAWVFSGAYREEGKKGTDLFDMPFGPEKAGAQMTWQPIKPRRRGHAGEYALHEIAKGDDCCGYVKTTIVSDRDRAAVLLLGSDDGVKAWLNGEVVLAKNETRALKCGEDAVNLSLKKGENPLLLKITQGGADWSFCCAIKSPEGGPIEGLKFEAK